MLRSTSIYVILWVACASACAEARSFSEDELWVVSTRTAGGSRLAGGRTFSVRKRTHETWSDTTCNELFAADPRTTLVYVHGNRVRSTEAVSRALKVCSKFSSSTQSPVRFVVWSWPSAQVRGQLRDVRLKACRADHECMNLAWLLSRLAVRNHVTLIGYSFGARIVTGGLHLLGGGSLLGEHLARSDSLNPIRVILVGAAIDRRWLQKDGAHAMAWSCAEHFVCIHNSRDPVLRRFHLLERRRSGGHAVGYFGMPISHSKVTQIDAALRIGPTHREDAYNRVMDAPNILAFGAWQEFQL